MMVLFEIRAKLTELYQKYSFVILTLCKLILMFVVFSEIKSSVGYYPMLNKTGVILGLSVLCSLVPSALMVLIVALYLFLQIWKANYLMALTVLVVCLILYCFFLRYTAKFGSVVVALPVLRKVGFPYMIPLSMGLFGNLFTIIPTSCGVVLYYLVRIVKENILAFQSLADAENPLGMYMEVVDKLVKNPAMYLTMFIYAITIVVVYFIRKLHMDYAFEISVGVGTGVMILGYIIGTLKYDMGVSLVSVLISSLISAGLVLLFLFAYRVLRYAAAESVQFEDDDYYYYVKAIPKVRANMPKKTVKKVITRTVASFEEDDDDEDEEGLEDALDAISRDNEKAAPVVANNSKPVATAPKAVADEDDEDDEDEEPQRPVRPVRQPRAVAKSESRRPVAPARKSESDKKPAKPVTPVVYDDEDDEDDYK